MSNETTIKLSANGFCEIFGFEHVPCVNTKIFKVGIQHLGLQHFKSASIDTQSALETITLEDDYGRYHISELSNSYHKYDNATGKLDFMIAFEVYPGPDDTGNLIIKRYHMYVAIDKENISHNRLVALPRIKNTSIHRPKKVVIDTSISFALIFYDDKIAMCNICNTNVNF